MGEGGEGSGVGVVVRRHVDGLDRSDRVAPGRGDPFLQLAHLVGQCGLVTDRRRHPAEQGRHLRTGLDEPENVVDEQEHVLVADVAEILGHGEGGQADAQPHPGRLVHLAVHERRSLEDAGLFHFQPQVVAFTGALAHAAENRDTAVLLGHAVDHLEDEHRFAHAGPTEQADLAALDEGFEEVDDLDPGLEHLRFRFQGVEVRRWAVDLPAVLDFAERVGVEHVTDDVENVARAPRHRPAR